MDDATKIEHWPLARVRPFAANPKKHSPAQVEQLAASIREFGWTIPILVDEEGTIIAGHGRALAAALLRLETVSVIVARGWTDDQKRAYRIADNKLTENGEWDDALLRLELGQLREAGIDLGITGFADDELNKLFSNVSGEDQVRADEQAAFDPDAVPTSRRGDRWHLGVHRLLCGDATSQSDVAMCMGGASAKLMVTDPPYGVRYDPTWRDRALEQKSKATGKVENDDRASWTMAWTLFRGDVAYVWHAGAHATAVARSLALAGFEIRSQIIWAKQHFVLSRGDYHWQHEPCWYAVRMGAAGGFVGGRDQSTLWQIDNNNPFGNAGTEAPSGHGTQKPIECMSRPILNNTVAGDGVYDPFVGSGTTIIAAEMTDRCAFAIDVDPLYVDMAVKRWQQFTGKPATLEGDGRTFAEVAAERMAAPPPPAAAKPAPPARKQQRRRA